MGSGEASQPASEYAGLRLRYWRAASGLTQEQVGHRLGYDHTYISKVENGCRRAPRDLLLRADALFGTGGEFAALWPMLAAERVRGAPVPLAGAATMVTPFPSTAVHSAPVLIWPSHLPDVSIRCPLHGVAGCEIAQPVAELRRLLAPSRGGMAALPGARVDPAMVHGLTGLLVAYTRANLELGTTGIVAPVEQYLRVIVGWLGSAHGALAPALLALAADYAHLAGWLRTENGQYGLGTAWFGRGAAWAEVSGNTVTSCELLARMSTVARLEGDAASAAEYGRAVRVTGWDKPWAVAYSELCEARGHALGCDRQAFERHAGRAVDLVDRSVEDAEAPWMSGSEGESMVQSHLAGGYRDLAARTGDRVAAMRAAACSQNALDVAPTELHPCRLLLALRLADAYACAGEPEQAVAIADPALPGLRSVRMTAIDHELRGFRARLNRWADLPSVRGFDERLRALDRT